MRTAGSGVGCTRLVNNAALDSRTQFPRAVDVPRAKCEETRTRARKIFFVILQHLLCSKTRTREHFYVDILYLRNTNCTIFTIDLRRVKLRFYTNFVRFSR